MTAPSDPLDYCPGCGTETANPWFACLCGYELTAADRAAIDQRQRDRRRQRRNGAELGQRAAAHADAIRRQYGRCPDGIEIRQPYPAARVIDIR